MASERLRRVLALAAELPAEERVELADEILRTVPMDGAEDELERRIDEALSGAEGIPWEQAHAASRADLEAIHRR